MNRLTTIIGTAIATSALGLAALASTGVASASKVDDTFISVITDEGIQTRTDLNEELAPYSINVFDVVLQ